MDDSRKIPSPNEFVDMFLEEDLILDIGSPPKQQNQDQYGIQYQRNYIEFLEKDIKALGKAHLYLVSLKPKFQQIEHYLRWHPTGKNTDDYLSLLNTYKIRLAFVRQQLKSKKESLLFEKEILEMNEASKRQHETVEVPAAKLILEQMNREKKSSNAQRELYHILRDMEKKEAEEATILLNARRKKAGIESLSVDHSLRNEYENRRRKLEENANQAWASEHQKVTNVAEGKFVGWDKIKNNRNKRLGFSPTSNDDPIIQEIRDRHKARLNEFRARKRNKTLAKQSQSRKARKDRKGRRSTRRT